MVEFRIPYELIDAAFAHPDVKKHTVLLAERVRDSVNRRLEADRSPIRYEVDSGVRPGAKKRPYGNVYPVVMEDRPASVAEWSAARAYLASAVGEHSRKSRGGR